MTATELYAAICLFLQENGLRREELGSGWWWGDAVQSESSLGEAVELLLAEKHGIDVRNAVPGEKQEFLG